MKKETLEEVLRKICPNYNDNSKWNKSELLSILEKVLQQERSQSIVPFDAYNIEVFAIKPDEQGKLFAYIGYKISNGNFHFNVVPFTEPQQERSYSEEDIKEAFRVGFNVGYNYETSPSYLTFEQWFEQFKKK
jgi:hypothetical protein